MDRIAELEAQVEILQRKNETLEIEAAQAKRSAEKMAIESHLRSAALQDGRFRGEKLVEDIVDNALRSGQWKLDSTGRLLRERDGTPDMDVNGDYLTPKAWIKSLEKTAPHFFQDVQKSDPSCPN